MSLSDIHMFEIFMKDVERLTFKKSVELIGLVESLYMPECIQESLGRCMLCVLFCIVTCDNGLCLVMTNKVESIYIMLILF